MSVYWLRTFPKIQVSVFDFKISRLNYLPQFNLEVKIFNNFHETEVFLTLKSFRICDFKIFIKNYLTLLSKYLNFITLGPHLKKNLFALTRPIRKKFLFFFKTNVFFFISGYFHSHKVFYSTFEHIFFLNLYQLTTGWVQAN